MRSRESAQRERSELHRVLSYQVYAPVLLRLTTNVDRTTPYERWNIGLPIVGDYDLVRSSLLKQNLQ